MISHTYRWHYMCLSHASAPTTPPVSTSPPVVPPTNNLPTSISSTHTHTPSKFDQQLLLHPHIKFPPALNSPPSPCETPPPLSPAVSFRELRNEFAQLQQNREHLLQRVARLEDLFLKFSNNPYSRSRGQCSPELPIQPTTWPSSQPNIQTYS